MEAGTTFIRTDSDKHLWVIISDPGADPDTVLLVNLTSWDTRKERACILGRGDHPWIRHETCVNYADSVVTTLTKLHAAQDGGAIKVQASLSPEVLKKLRDGALKSERMSLDNAEVLIQQGLVDC